MQYHSSMGTTGKQIDYMRNTPEYMHEVAPLPKEDGGGFVITFPDLPGCMSDGETIEETIANGRDAFLAWAMGTGYWGNGTGY